MSLRLGAALAAVISLGAGAVADAATLTRTPYLQQVTTGSALVAFRLDTACSTAQVRYGPEGGALGALAKSASTATTHAVPLSGLEPARRYTYVVEACGVTTEPRSFVTASQPGSETVHFLALGDMGTASTGQKAVAAAMAAARPELWVTMGDNAYDSGTEAEFQTRFFEPMAALLGIAPTFASPGNHEYGTPGAMPYINNFYLPTNNPARTERYYSFDWGPVHFVSLDSQCGLGYTSTSDCSAAAQKAWLEADLEATTQPWKVVFFHHPPWSSGVHGSYTAVRNAWVPLFERHGVDLVLTGHDHNYERTRPMLGSAEASGTQRGVVYLVVGGGGAALRPFDASAPSWSAVRNDTDFGFLDVKVDKGTLTARALSPTGRTIDSFTLSKAWTYPPGTVTVLLASERGKAPFTTQLSATSNISGATLTWDFGDGTTGTGERVSHTWTRNGSYQVVVTARTGDGRTASTTQSIVVDPGEAIPPTEGVPTTPPSQPTAAAGGTGGTDAPEGAGCAASPGLALPAALLALHGLVRRRRAA